MLSSFGAVFSLVTDASSYMGFEASAYSVFDADLCYSKVDIRDFEATDFLSRYWFDASRPRFLLSFSSRSIFTE